MLKALTTVTGKAKAAFARFCLLTAILGLSITPVMAQGDPAPDLWADATQAATDAAGNISTFLIALFAVPLAFFVYRLVRRAIGG